MINTIAQIDLNSVVTKDFYDTYSETLWNIPLLISFLGTVTAAITACIVAYVAWKQHKLEKERLKLDLFEKRYAVYKAFQRALSIVLVEGRFDTENLFKFRADTLDAYFLFDQEIWEYRQKIDKLLLDLCFAPEKYERLPIGAERTRCAEEEKKILKQLTDELPKLKDIFKSYLEFGKWN